MWRKLFAPHIINLGTRSGQSHDPAATPDESPISFNQVGSAPKQVWTLWGSFVPARNQTTLPWH